MRNDEFNHLSGITDYTSAPACELQPDLDRYRLLLSGVKVSNDEADEFLRELWSVMAGFVQLGFDFDACGYLLAELDQHAVRESDALNSPFSITTETPPGSGEKEGSA